MKTKKTTENYTGMVIFNENKKVFSICDVALEENELVLNVYNAINC